MDPFLGEIRILPFGFAPRGWAPCDGQLLSIAQNQALFALIGTRFGGNGTTTFALPDLRGRSPIGAAPQTPVGQVAHALTAAELPPRSSPATQTSFAAGEASAGGTATAVAPATAGAAESRATATRQPGLVLSFVIALQGVFPSRD